MIERVGVCSWSLRQNRVEGLVQSLKEIDIRTLQVAILPLTEDREQIDQLEHAIEMGQVELCSGMMQTLGEDYTSLESIRQTGGLRPDKHWEANLRHAESCAEIGARLGLGLVTLHAGFLPYDNPVQLARIVDRICQVAQVFEAKGITLGLETGQERAETLLELLSTISTRAQVRVNFDPANMILYDMGDPIEALKALSEFIVQVHLKDAIRTKKTGQWGDEVAAGSGEVDWDSFFELVEGFVQPLDIVIEREAGDQRIEDIRLASKLASTQIARVRS